MSAEKKTAILEIGSELWSTTKATGNWLGGALKGEFNDKATLGQIVFDAVISMFPVAGEVTAVRDLIAIANRMVGNKKEQEKVINWISIILCLLPLIPIFGGILKGIGRLLITVIKDASKVAVVATDILAFLRKMGYGDPIKFINSLKFSKYQTKILIEFKNFIRRLKQAFQFFNKKMGAVLPNDMKIQLNSMGPKLDELARLADKMIPSAIKELDSALNKVRTEMINQMNKAGAKIGGQTKVLTTEARIATSSATKIKSLGHTPAKLSKYVHKPGWPDLRKNVDAKGFYYTIGSFSSKANIEAKLLKSGSKVGLARVIETADPRITGAFWAEKLPKCGKDWRLDCAVKGGWSVNGSYVKLDRIPTIQEMRKLGIKVADDWDGLRVWRGKIAEQLDNEDSIAKGAKATNLLLPGGDIQLYIDFRDPHNLPVAEYLKKIAKVIPTNWKDAKIPQDITSVVAYLEKREISKKIAQQGQIARTVSATGRAVTQDQKK